MSALAKVAPLRAEIRLAQAVSQFEADLSTNQKTTFRTFKTQSCDTAPGIHDVMRLTANIDREARQKINGSRCFGPRLTNILQSIQQFAAIGDVVIGGSQNIVACSVWALARFTLLAIVHSASTFEKLSMLLMIAGRSAPRYERIALLYPQSRLLQSHLSEYFIVVVHLCHHVFKFTKKTTFGQLVAALADSDMNTFQANLELWAGLIREEINVLNIEEQKSSLKLLWRISNFETNRQRLEVHARILDAFSTYDYQTAWKQTRKLGNSSFFYQNSNYKDWKESLSSSTLVCIGKLGSGKSVVLANVIDDLNLLVQTAECPVTYFFCRYDNPDSLTARSILGSLARQLLSPLADLSIIEDILNDNTLVLDSDAVVNSIKRALPPGSESYIVLDGLDTCDELERKELIGHICKLQHTCKLRLCVSFTLEANIDVQLSLVDFANYKIINMPEENPDIESFVNAELARRIESQRLKIGDKSLIIEIQDALLEGAQGMFLWVALQIRSLCDARTDKAIRQALTELPKDLPQTFSRILQKSSQADEGYQARTLDLITVARRPLTTGELREALSVVPDNFTWDPSQQLNDVYAALKDCGSLITIDEEDCTVRFIHHSVKKFLLSGYKNSVGKIFTRAKAEMTMMRIATTYLNYGVFDTQISLKPDSQINPDFAPSKIIQSTAISSTAKNIALQLLKRKGKQKFLLGKALEGTSEHFKHAPMHEFLFYPYAKLYWLHHICSSVLVQDIANIDASDKDGESLLHWAIRRGNDAIVKLLLSNGARFESYNRYEETPLMLASKLGRLEAIKLLHDIGADISIGESLTVASLHGQEAVVKFMLDRGADPNSGDTFNREALSLASKSGHLGIMALLLKKGANPSSRDNGGNTALILASNSGHLAAVELLLSKDVDPNVSNEKDYTALLLASQNGHLGIVALLLDKGANPSSRDDEGGIPLTLASARGHIPVVELLLVKGVDPNIADSRGRTALSLAAEGGHLTIVKLLLQMGASINCKTKKQQTALSLALEGEHLRVAEVLIKEGVNIEGQNQQHQAALLWASRGGYEATVKFLLERGVDPNSKDGMFQTALSLASERGHIMVVESLLEMGADPESKDQRGQTALLVALRSGQGAVVELLIKIGANAKVIDNCAEASLLLASANGHQLLVKTLLEMGANINSKDQNGQTALSIALKNRHLSVVELLINEGADLDSKNEAGDTALLFASRHGLLKLVGFLLEKGANLETKNMRGQTAAMLALAFGHRATLKLLTERAEELKRNKKEAEGS